MNKFSNLNYQKDFQLQEIVYKISENRHIADTEIINFILNSNTFDLLKFSQYLRNRENNLQYNYLFQKNIYKFN